MMSTELMLAWVAAGVGVGAAQAWVLARRANPAMGRHKAWLSVRLAVVFSFFAAAVQDDALVFAIEAWGAGFFACVFFLATRWKSA
jgi:hypothetical protein